MDDFSNDHNNIFDPFLIDNVVNSENNGNFGLNASGDLLFQKIIKLISFVAVFLVLAGLLYVVENYFIQALAVLAIIVYVILLCRAIKHNQKQMLICLGIIFVITASIIGTVNYHNETAKQKEYDLKISSVKTYCESYNLKNIEVKIYKYKEKSSFWVAYIECSNFSSLSYSQMFNFSKYIVNLNSNYFFLESVMSNGDEYKIYESSLSIYKNNEEIYDDYYNSDSYLSTLENE